MCIARYAGSIHRRLSEGRCRGASCAESGRVIVRHSPCTPWRLRRVRQGRSALLPRYPILLAPRAAWKGCPSPGPLPWRCRNERTRSESLASRGDGPPLSILAFLVRRAPKTPGYTARSIGRSSQDSKLLPDDPVLFSKQVFVARPASKAARVQKELHGRQLRRTGTTSLQCRRTGLFLAPAHPSVLLPMGLEIWHRMFRAAWCCPAVAKETRNGKTTNHRYRSRNRRTARHWATSC
ncbi:hypothetical protein COL8621_01290 [Actibacterium lipolyticum]|uniref:Uncharacterized protein n=1 Tax=Actibacterium lipolyticum TaxID=1524263 RepID=A0A238JUQ8_9RHOB|nr:hypothetical protein COL8621_01290 [Actibacterium lipolyticum]